MKRAVVNRFGGPEVVEVIDDDQPEPAAGEVRVRVLAAGVSFTDTLIRAGSYLGGPKPPFTPGYELVGVVEEMGPGCTRLREGDRVAALTVHGSYAEQVCLPEAQAVPVPAELDPAELVSLVLSYVTAQQLLTRVAEAERGETVLVHGAAGLVGTAVLELAGPAGLRVYGTASGEGCARVERLGERRSTTGMRTSWRGCGRRPPRASTSPSTASEAPSRAAPIARWAPAAGS